ncbi:hypothetical protein HPB47_013424, partial [Ixodes persulcatus]
RPVWKITVRGALLSVYARRAQLAQGFPCGKVGSDEFTPAFICSSALVGVYFNRCCMPVRQVTRGDHGRCPVNLRRKEKAESEALLRSRMHDRPAKQDPVLFSQWDRNIPRGDTHLQENSA